MGNVINYAYRFYDRDDWEKQFGSIEAPYVEEYRTEPFSRRFVRHLPAWYAQKHPDEDWAETFAVWVTPGRDWRSEYADWPAPRASRRTRCASRGPARSEEHTSELQSLTKLVCRLLLA